MNLASLRETQERLARRVRLVPLAGEPRLVAGVDVAYEREGERCYGAAVVVDLADLSTVARAVAVARVTMPYVPGFLSFREVPVLVEALACLPLAPEVVLVDGQGALHPRGLGLASHLGLETGFPTVGVAKKPLVGRWEDPGEEPGDFAPVVFRGEVRGAALRTRAGVKPVFVSPGHLVDLPSALRLVRRCLGGFRLPEPVRRAHLLSQEARRASGGDDGRKL